MPERVLQGTSKRPKDASDSSNKSAIEYSMDTLPVVLLGAVLEFASHDELHAAERVCTALRAAVSSGGLWETMARRRVTLCEEEAPKDEMSWKNLQCLVARPCDRNTRLLHDVTACSSIDRPVETPTNTLQPSRCWLSLRSSSDRSVSKVGRQEDNLVQWNLANVAQIQCGCEMGDACYWSTSPSTDKDTKDFIDYTVYGKSVVSRLQIIPYRAFWHPDSPTYAPRAVSVTFYRNQPSADAASGSPKELLYQSPVYPLVNEMQLQEFKLPTKIWLPTGGVMRLNLLGRYQAETFDLPPWVPAEDQVPNYYSCLSFVNALGISAARRRASGRQRAASFC